MRRSLLGVLAALLVIGSTSAQAGNPRLVQSPDGTLYVIAGEARHRIVPAPTTNEELLKIAEAEPWDDGTIALVPAPPAAPAAPVAPAAAPIPVAAPPPPAPAAPAVKRVGETTILTTPSGLRLAITAHDVTDPAQSSNRFNAPDGRYVVVDWSIKNEGVVDFDPGYGDFKIQTADGFVVQRGNHAGHRAPQLDTAKLAPGQQVRGFLAYDVPAGQVLKALIYQPSGGRQFVIAELP